MTISPAPERMKVIRPKNYPFLESVVGPPLPYRSPRHLHEELEISLNPGLSWHEICRGQTFHVPPDAILITPPEEPHTAFSPEKGSGDYLGLRIQPAYLESTLSEMAEHPQTMLTFSELLVNDETFLQHLLAFHAALQGEQNFRLEQDALLQYIILHLLRLSTQRFSLRPPGSENGAVRTAKMYLQDHFQENISLQQLAQQVHLSPFYFSRVFQAAVGFPPHAYQTQIRIIHAKKLLADNTSLAEVAVRTGFTSQSHLGLHFKRLVGITPGEFALDSQI